MDKTAAFEVGIITALEKHAVEGATKTVAGVTKIKRGGKWVSPTAQATLESVAYRPGIKQAFDWKSLLKKKTKKKLVPSFKGHTKAIQQAVKPGTTTSRIGKVTTRAWDPMQQAVRQASHVTGVPGWTT